MSIYEKKPRIGNDGAQQRKLRLDALRQFIIKYWNMKGNMSTLDIHRIIGGYMLESGLTRRRVKEYLNDLDYAGVIEVDKNGQVTLLLGKE